ncbi:MAG: type II toxin-antitoxin system VapC family toxin [Bacteroidetes bacterium]|nr:type II toxin-antitoxin system VapC family toxin [Bacteroidota bacterium]
MCDTDVLIDYFDNSKPRHSSTVQIIDSVIGLDNVVISAITRMELIAGAENKMELRLLNKNIDRFNVLLINPAICSIALTLMENYRLSHKLDIPDALIAATTKYADFKLFTYNIKDYKFIDGLNLYKISH